MLESHEKGQSLSSPSTHSKDIGDTAAVATAAAATAAAAAPSAAVGIFSSKAVKDPLKETVPSGDELAALRRAAADEASFDPSRIPRIWLGLLLPSLSSPAAAAAADGGEGGFRAQGLFPCQSYDDFFVKAVPLLRLLHASLAYAPRLLLGVLGICRDFAAAVRAGEETEDWRYEQLVSCYTTRRVGAPSGGPYGPPPAEDTLRVLF